MRFYKTLYTSNKQRSSTLSDSLCNFKENIIPLENDDMLSCEGKVTQEECLKALNEFKNEKSPGTDGQQAEFYKHFWEELHTDMLQCFDYAYDSGKVSISQRRGIITLIGNRTKILLYSITSDQYRF